MDEEIDALVSRRTWELVSAPTDVVGCRSIYTLKYRPNGLLDRYKTRFITKGYTQTYGVDYFETFSPIARLNSIMILFSIVANLSWSLLQLNVKNAFLYGMVIWRRYIWSNLRSMLLGGNKVCRLRKAIYRLKQSPRVWYKKFSITISGIGFHHCHSDHSVFLQHTKSGLVILVVYVNDILLIGSDSAGLLETKEYLRCHFVTKNMGKPKYYLEIKVIHQKHSVLSQMKYALNIMETGLLGCKPASTKPMWTCWLMVVTFLMIQEGIKDWLKIDLSNSY